MTSGARFRKIAFALVGVGSTDEVIKAHFKIISAISRNIFDIAEAFDVSTSAVRKWQKTPEWEKALDVFGYEGDRTFAIQKTRDTQREQGEIFEKAKEAYQQAIQDGEPQHKWATIAANAVGLTRRRVHTWAMKHGWRNAI